MSDPEERELRINLMQTAIELYMAQLRWELWKAPAAMVAAAAVFGGSVVGVANLLSSRPVQPQPPIVIQLQTPIAK